MLINTNSNAFKITRGVISLAAGIGAAALAKDAIAKLHYIPTRKYQVVTVAVATFAIGGLVSNTINQFTKESINDLAEAANSIADSTKGIKVTVSDALKA